MLWEEPTPHLIQKNQGTRNQNCIVLSCRLVWVILHFNDKGHTLLCALWKNLFGTLPSARGQHELLFFHHPTQVDQRVSHAAQSRVDADVGLLCNFLEAQIVFKSHFDHRTLILG